MQKKHLFIPLLFLWNFLLGCGDTLLEDLILSEDINKKFDLPAEINESSGIIIYDSLIWTFNDSGRDNILYGLDLQDGSIKKRIYINTENKDWEDIAQDTINIYLGDIGNNLGNRTDLRIYIIPKDSIKNLPEQHITAEEINYYYGEQLDFTEQLEANAFDCESMFSLGDSLYLFTKNWTEDLTSLYQLPKEPGNYRARQIASFGSDGLITGADFNPDSHELVICGYKQYVPYIIYFENADQLNLNDIPKVRVDFFDRFGLQIEGVTIDNQVIYLSAEDSFEPQALFSYQPE